MKNAKKFDADLLDSREAKRLKLINYELKLQLYTWNRIKTFDPNDQNYSYMVQVYADRIKASMDRVFALEIRHYVSMNVKNYHL